jgi:hypothetical protein
LQSQNIRIKKKKKRKTQGNTGPRKGHSLKKKKTHLWNGFCVYAVYGVPDILYMGDMKKPS